MTTTSHQTTGSPEIPMWDPPCIACGKPIGVAMPANKYIGRTRCDDCSGQANLQRLRGAGIPEWFIAQKGSLETFDNRGNRSLLSAIEKCNVLVGQRTLLDRTWLVL